jgi:aminoglycoside phosphotransferase (APT) family kinase protein
LDDDYVAQFGRLLAAIHRHAYERRQEISPVFADRTFFETLRLEPYYGYTAAQVPAAASFLHQLIEETLARRITLVHGDYSPKNILVYQGRLILLDHEVIHFGDPAFDLGFSLTHFLSKAHHLSQQRTDFAQAAGRYWQIYRQTLGDLPWTGDLEAYAVRHTLACLLARVNGRSPLEYLDTAARSRQREVATLLMQNAPTTMSDLFDQFTRMV